MSLKNTEIGWMKSKRRKLISSWKQMKRKRYVNVYFLYNIKTSFTYIYYFRLMKQMQMKLLRPFIKLLHQRNAKTSRIFIKTRRRKRRRHMPRIMKIIYLTSRRINTPRTVWRSTLLSVKL